MGFNPIEGSPTQTRTHYAQKGAVRGEEKTRGPTTSYARLQHLPTAPGGNHNSSFDPRKTEHRHNGRRGQVRVRVCLPACLVSGSGACASSCE